MEKALKKEKLRAVNLCAQVNGGKRLNRAPWNFALAQGSVTALIGSNGSGKTTLLNAIMGNHHRLSGEVFVEKLESPVTKWGTKLFASVFSYLPQEPIYDPYQTVRNHLILALNSEIGLFEKINPDQEARLERILFDFGLSGMQSKALEELSAGERQRVFLARCLLQKSSIVLLDEPTNHLDPNGIEAFWSLLTKNRREKTVLVATHDLSQIEKNCDWVCILSKGDLVFSAEVESYRARVADH
jgi:ABC-2 type transport system ATP-binding protein